MPETSLAAAIGPRTESSRIASEPLEKKKPINVRNRHATRPWQHVLEPLSGYLWIGALLANDKLLRRDPRMFTSAFNFGPNRDSNRTVGELVEEVLKHWPGKWQDQTDPNAPHEAGLLQLSTDKAYALLRWFPIWSFAESIGETVDWYYNAQHKRGAKEFQKQTQAQIAKYIESARAIGAPWTAHS